MARLRKVGAHLMGEARELHVVFAGDQVDREADLFQAMPQRGECPGADILQAERQTFRVVLGTTGEDGMSAVMLSAGQQDDWTATPDPTSMNSQGVLAGALSAPFAATGPTVSCPAHG